MRHEESNQTNKQKGSRILLCAVQKDRWVKSMSSIAPWGLKMHTGYITSFFLIYVVHAFG